MNICTCKHIKKGMECLKCGYPYSEAMVSDDGTDCTCTNPECSECENCGNHKFFCICKNNSVVSAWKVYDGYCAYRELNGERVAFIEKTPRVKHPDTGEWIYGTKGTGGGNPKKDETYGFYKPSRIWCDKKLKEFGYII